MTRDASKRHTTTAGEMLVGARGARKAVPSMKTGLKFPRWLQEDFWIIGAEGENDDSGDGGGNDDDSNSGNDGGDDGGDGENNDDDGDNDDDDDAFKSPGAKRALLADYARVKQEKKAADKELAKLRKAQEDAKLKDKSETEQATAKAKAAEERAAKLAQGFVKLALDRAIEAEARKLKFRDPDDALAMIARSSLGVEQDEDDPTDINIDTKTVKDAVKQLAAKKPHLIASGTDDDDATGGQFGRGGRRKDNSDDALRQKYPSLEG